MGGDLLSFVRCHEERTFGGVLYMPPRTETVVQFMWQSLQGLDYLHHHCIAHRDIKAENYLRQGRNETASIKLIDFGLSEHYLPGKRMHNRVGTIGYCAPEIMEPGPLGYSELCDIWSAGVLFYLLFVGEYPIFIPKGCSMKEAFQITMETEINYKKGIWKAHAQPVIDILTMLLAKDASDRPSAKLLLTNPWLRQVGRDQDSASPSNCCGCIW